MTTFKSNRLVLICAMGVAVAASAAAEAPPPREEFKLLFSNQQDITNTWGKIHFGTTSLQKIRDCQEPGFSIAHCIPNKDGTWGVYGQIYKITVADKLAIWKLIYATTRDGSTFENVETLFESEPAAWTDHMGIAYNSQAKEFLLMKIKVDQEIGFGYTAFFSADGRNWKEHPKNPLHFAGDSIGLFWSPTAKRFVATEKTGQAFLKYLWDGTPGVIKNTNLLKRRVFVIRSSPDGREWQPSCSETDVWNRHKGYASMPTEAMTTPDDNDPPDLEFYRGIGFWYHDRSYMFVLNYAPSPLAPQKHGPHLDTEWWVSHDGLKWDRPYRDVNASNIGFPHLNCITHNPMIINGQLLFHDGNQLLGMKQDRISYVGARANAEFSTVPFTMPQGDLLLNAAIPSPDRPFATQQAYVMAAVLDENGAVLPGFEQDKCLIKTGDQIDLPLLWSGKSARELAGRTISLRFYLRSANIYAVTVKEIK